jgi:hypothetical protein
MLDATPLLRLYARYRRRQLGALDAASTQAEQLRQLVFTARQTRFGREHDFGEIKSVADFQARVPLRRYEAFWQDYWQGAFPRLENLTWPGLIPYFAVSSGTTQGSTKFLPCSDAMVRSNRKAAADLLVHHIANRPHSRLLAGRSFMLGGSVDLVTQAPGVLSGDLSGIAARTMPWWASLRSFPPRELETISDWEEKIDRFARAALNADIRAIGGVPSWMLIFFEKLAELKSQNSFHINMLNESFELLIHGGVNFDPYRDRFAQLLENTNVETREVYPASEGFFAIADRGDGDGMRLNLDHGLFYEFVPVDELDSANPTRHWIANAELGVDYALVVSTCAGLWAYVVGDMVRLVERAPPRILMTGRTAQMLSAFGEHLIGEEIEAAVADAAHAIATTVTDYAVGSLFPDDDTPRGGHLYVVEFDTPPEAEPLERFAAVLDRHLRKTNEDYAAHRAEGFGLDAPRLRPVPHGTFTAWMKHRGKLGGQHKVPRVINDPALFAELLAFTAPD